MNKRKKILIETTRAILFSQETFVTCLVISSIAIMHRQTGSLPFLDIFKKNTVYIFLPAIPAIYIINCKLMYEVYKDKKLQASPIWTQSQSILLASIIILTTSSMISIPFFLHQNMTTYAFFIIGGAVTIVNTITNINAFLSIKVTKNRAKEYIRQRKYKRK